MHEAYRSQIKILRHQRPLLKLTESNSFSSAEIVSHS